MEEDVADAGGRRPIGHEGLEEPVVGSVAGPSVCLITCNALRCNIKSTEEGGARTPNLDVVYRTSERADTKRACMPTVRYDASRQTTSRLHRRENRQDNSPQLCKALPINKQIQGIYRCPCFNTWVECVRRPCRDQVFCILLSPIPNNKTIGFDDTQWPTR